MSTILVTGGAGFIGANFVIAALRRSGTTVVNLDALTYAGHRASLKPVADDPNHIFVEGDICDHELVAALLRRHRPSVIMHFAAETHVDRSIEGPQAFIRTNIEGTFQLLECARRHFEALSPEQKAAFRFVHVSTDEVYGSCEAGGYFRETSPYAPNSPYAASKAASDHWVRAYHRTYGLPTIITHCSNNYGPLQFPEKLIPHMIFRALSGATLPVYGDGQQVRDWLHVDDHCHALEVIASRGLPGETYNIGGNNEIANLDLVRELCDILDERAPSQHPYASQITHVTDRPGHDRRYAIDATKMQAELGWRPQKTFSAGLRDTVDWYLANIDWCNAVTNGHYQFQRIGLVERSAA
jgi:dTDP-glucose 4,6-dehydratase